jgi:tetratricopeptide (TPR) repeat protein
MSTTVILMTFSSERRPSKKGNFDLDVRPTILPVLAFASYHHHFCSQLFFITLASTMAAPNQGIIALNSKAVAKMCQGQYQDATMLLGRALRRVKERMLDPKFVSDGGDFDDEHYAAEDYTVRSCYIEVDESNSSSVFSMYNRALVVHGSDNETIFSSRNEATVSGILLYNLGLCSHIQALSGMDEHHKLEKAMQFYKAAASIINLNQNLCGADRLLFLAIYNNKAHIFANLFCEEEAQQCLAWLQQGLEQTEEGDAEVDDSVNRDLVDIHLNVALFHGTKSHAPAA